MERPRSRAMSSSSTGSMPESNASNSGVKKVACRHWVSKGHCDLGSNCKFAHVAQDTTQSSAARTKTVLCSNYTNTGTCQYGDNCTFAHGEEELRATNNTPHPNTYKTKMCKTFLSGGSCPSGASCHFAHGSRELRNMFRPGVGHGPGYQSSNGGGGVWPAPNAKTVLCKNWSESGSCSYGENCNFAHGEDQIRGPKEVKIISRNPLYKTTMCKQYTEAEFCELGEDCHFAHGQDELRVVRGGNVASTYGGGFGYGSLAAGKAGAQYKTSLCKQWSEGTVCQYGADCLYAHGPVELREYTVPESKNEYKTVLCKNWEKDGKCEWGEQCKWAHGKEDLQAGHSRAGMGWNSQYKTVVCTKWEEGKCEYGPRCMFAHGQAELRSAQHRVVITSPQYKTVLCQQDPCQFGDSCSFAHSQGELRTVQQNLAEINPNYKGTLCKFFMSTGECEFGSICQYAHGNMELRNTGLIGGGTSKQSNHNYSTVGITSPQYKTTLCKNYQDSGRCEFGARCQFAHGQLELRTLAQNYLQLNPQYKTTLCSHYTEHGTCPQGHNCQFSHGRQELRQSVVDRAPPMKSALCKIWLQTGVCRNRAMCGAAHGQNELGRTLVGAGGENGGGSGYKQQPVRSGEGNYKTQPCRNMKDTGRCSYGERCQFAHSYQEMSAALNIGGGHAGHHGVAGGARSGSSSGGKPVKVVLCQQHSQTGQCERGSACQFAHGVQELHFYRAKQVPNYKTTLCQPWESTGQCSYGETCMYAHGRGQLRAVQVQDRNKDNNMDIEAQPSSKRIRM